ncbi:hypothetical protein GCM10010172_06270 [Paractinoplanes ferrugineus]|uniref:LPXTG-motif cell wall-anchored protein n=1 Tax=Paractinoplanes ferrugineus TaxID=113564 RepID=A0A919J8E2_9ACTN|nr:LPXTG cell wall anchor domain-containing protein [Actinoplanes ferrugineus]GIE12456.1 hypothetical protein Afe05nite_42960 [Actinoplanes ferrugineus]
MRAKSAAGILMALALLIPAAPAAAQAAPPGLNAACQTVERVVYQDFRKLITSDLDTATDVQVRILANQILAEATAESLPLVPDRVQEKLDGTPAELRAFLKSDVLQAWAVDLRIAALRTLTDAGRNVSSAAKKALDTGTVDAHLTFLNDGLHAARALDCAAQPTTKPTVEPTPTKTAAPAPTSSTSRTGAAGQDGGQDGGGLARTGADTAVVAAVGAALLLLGGTGFLLARRRRSRFVA